jgi:hypothetical protein
VNERDGAHGARVDGDRPERRRVEAPFNLRAEHFGRVLEGAVRVLL